MKNLILFLFTLIFPFFLVAQAPSIVWAKNFGGARTDFGRSIVVTDDNKYVVAGGILSNPNDTFIRTTQLDAWVIKLDANGNILWQKTYGGLGDDSATKIVQTSDKGFIIVGESRSNDGDFRNNKGSFDVWVLKIDSVGTLEWQKTFGGSDSDYASSVIQTQYGEYIINATSRSKDGDFPSNYGEEDVWILKLNSFGSLIWKKHLGGNSIDFSKDIINIDNESYLTLGETRSIDGDMTGFKGDFIFKIDSSGNIVWRKSHGNPYNNASIFNGYSSAVITATKDIIVVGYMWIFASSNNQHNFLDFSISQLDSEGNLKWLKFYGGTGVEYANSVKITPRGDIIVLGDVRSKDFDVDCNHGKQDMWLLKTDSIGNLIYKICLGGMSDDYGLECILTKDNSILVVGDTDSNNGTFGENKGIVDMSIAKIRDPFLTQISENNLDLNINIFPNPLSNYLNIDNNSSQYLDIQLVNIFGQIVFKGFCPEGKQIFDFSHLPSGLYILIGKDTKKNSFSKAIRIQR
jgi:Secretion system C-terminal sorting domain